MHNTDIRIIGTGIGLPERVVSNHELVERSGISSDWVRERLGIIERRYCGSGEMTSDLAASAARLAMENAGVVPSDIELLILATATPDLRAPATACIVQRKLGIKGGIAFDVSAVCSGFLFALTTARHYLKVGYCRTALVIGADTFSKVTDPDRRDNVFFGDGSGAVVLRADRRRARLFESELLSLGSGEQNFSINNSSGMFEMDGKSVFEDAVHSVPMCIQRLLEKTNRRTEEIDIVVPHQPSISMLREIARRSSLDFSRFVTNMDRYANTAGATIPISLHEAVVSGRISAGNLVLFAAAGAGMTAGAALLEW